MSESNLEELMYEHLHSLDARIVAAVDLGRLAFGMFREVPNVFVLPIAQLHSAALALRRVSVGSDDGLVLSRP